MIDQEKAGAIRKKIGIILHQMKGSAFYKADGKNITLDFRDFEQPDVVPPEALQDFEVADEQVKLLRMLYEAQDPEGKQYALEEVASRFQGVNGRLLMFMARHGSVRKALDLFKATFIVDIAADVITPIAYMLCFDHGHVSEADLDLICKELSEVAAQARKDFPTVPRPRETRVAMLPPPSEAQRLAYRREMARERFEKYVQYICGQVAAIHYVRLKRELEEGANFEINQDRDRLLGTLQAFGFSPRLIEFLQFAEQEFGKAGGEFSYKTCIDQIRTFFSELLNETAEKVAGSRNSTLEKEGVNRGRPVEVRDYLGKVGFFSEQFKALVTGLYKFMSDEGTHTLGATKDVARLARNLSVELGLLILKRVAGWK
jgi:hypothetical protein